jgi:hypothetical protein
VPKTLEGEIKAPGPPAAHVNSLASGLKLGNPSDSLLALYSLLGVRYEPTARAVGYGREGRDNNRQRPTGLPVLAFNPRLSVGILTRADRPNLHITEKENPHRLKAGEDWPKGSGAYRDRTDDPLLAKQVLSQLS